MGEYRVRAIRFVQNGRVFYTVAAPAREIIERCRVDVWDADVAESERGYQRPLNRARVKGVAAYVVKSDAVMPVGGLVNARAEEAESWGSRLSFEADPGERGSVRSGWLTIPDAALPLWTVDMQHRLGGFQHAIEELERQEIAEFPICLTIADGLEKLEEIQQFDVINTTQKKVPTDLARQLMATEYQHGRLGDPAKEWQARGALVANQLNETAEVLRGKILPPNKVASKARGAITKQTTFVSSLKPVLTSPYMAKMPIEHLSRLVDVYWQAVAKTFPHAVEFPKQTVIFKGPGVYPLHLLMPEVMEVVRSKSQPLDVASMAGVMAGWKELGKDYWDSDNVYTGATRFGSSGQGHARIAAELREKLPEPEYEPFE